MSIYESRYCKFGSALLGAGVGFVEKTVEEAATSTTEEK